MILKICKTVDTGFLKKWKKHLVKILEGNLIFYKMTTQPAAGQTFRTLLSIIFFFPLIFDNMAFADLTLKILSLMSFRHHGFWTGKLISNIYHSVFFGWHRFIVGLANFCGFDMLREILRRILASGGSRGTYRSVICMAWILTFLALSVIITFLYLGFSVKHALYVWILYTFWMQHSSFVVVTSTIGKNNSTGKCRLSTAGHSTAKQMINKTFAVCICSCVAAACRGFLK